MDKIIKSYTIPSPAEVVWNALTDPHEIELWGGGPVVMSEKEGEEFQLWGGEIHGKNIQVVKHELLKQEWFGGKWKTPSLVTFTLTEEEDETRLELLQENFPMEERFALDEAWDADYLGPLTAYIEGQPENF